MLETILGGIALGAGGGIIDNAVGYYTQKNLNRQANNDYRRNLKLSQQLNIEAQRKAIEQSTSALKKAGLSPALAAQGSFSAPAASAPLGQSSAPNPNFDFGSSIAAVKQAQMLESEKENLSSQTEYNTAAAEKQRADAALLRQEVDNRKQDIKESESRISLNSQQEAMLVDLAKKYQTEGLLLGTEYSRMLSQDSFAHAALMEFCNRRIAGSQTEADRDFWTGLRAIGQRNKFDSGSLMAMSLFSEAWNSLDVTETEVGARAIQRFIQTLQSNDDEYLETIARMPVYQAKLVFGQTAEAFQNAAFRKAYREDLIPSEKDKLDEDVRVLKHNDPAGMLKDGDFLGFGVYAGSAVLRFGGQILAARQFGKGGVLSDPRGKQPNGQPKDASSPTGTPSKTAPSRKPSNPSQAAKDDVVKRRLYMSLGVERTDKLWSGYRKSDAKTFDEFLKREGIGQKRNWSDSDWMQ